jgi:hypothetical protein
MDVAGWIVAAATAIGGIITIWFAKRREIRQDEIAVLNQAITELRKDRDSIKQELKELYTLRETEKKARDLEVGKLKDEHTACLLIQEGLKAKIIVLEAQVVSLNERLPHATQANSGS